MYLYLKIARCLMAKKGKKRKRKEKKKKKKGICAAQERERRCNSE